MTQVCGTLLIKILIVQPLTKSPVKQMQAHKQKQRRETQVENCPRENTSFVGTLILNVNKDWIQKAVSNRVNGNAIIIIFNIIRVRVIKFENQLLKTQSLLLSTIMKTWHVFWLISSVCTEWLWIDNILSTSQVPGLE